MAGVDEVEQTPRAPLDAATPQAGDHPAEQTASGPAGEQTPQARPPADGLAGAAAPAAPGDPQAVAQAGAPVDEQAPGFGERGRMRRRARFLRKARELAYRDLGGLVFDLHRFGQRNDQLVLLKLATLRQIDTELRELERALNDRRPVTVLREVGIAACPRCAAIHGGDDRFCPACGLAFDTHAERPIATAPVAPQASPQPVQPAHPAETGEQAPAPTAPPAHTPPTQTPASPPAVTDRSMGRPAASPAASSPAQPAPPSPARGEPEGAREDEPTQILRPPASDA